MEEIEALNNNLGSFLSLRPYVFQKFTESGLILAREIIAKARDEIIEYCYDDLAKELSEKD